MKNYGVNPILQLALHLWKKTRLLLICLLMTTSFAFSQTPLSISGTVINADGEKLTGVTVVVRGTTNGTITDIEGNYTIDNVPGNATLVFSFIGMKSLDIPVSNRTKIDVTLLEENIGLEEVVVVGYGVQKKSSVTGAISQVKAEDLENRTITRPEQALQGKTAGVQVVNTSSAPGSGVQVRIRGINSNGSSEPLYVVDGRIASDIGGIDPNDIESMEVIKDAASAAIYGVRAGNGVVLITTKKGVEGKTTISYDYQLTSQNIARIPEVMNSEQYIDFMTEANYISMEKIIQNWDFNTNTDWTKVAFEPSIMQRHNLAFQGGNRTSKFYLSLSYLDNNGFVVGDADVYKRYTATINASYDIKPWFEIGTNNQIEYYTRQSVAEGSEYGSLLMATLQLDPLTPVSYSPDKLPEHMQNGLAAGHTYLQDENGNYYSTSAYQETDNYNPYIMRDKTYSESKGFNLNGVIYGNLKPIKSLVVTSRFAYRLSGNTSYTVNNDFYVNPTVNQDYLSVNANASVPIYFQLENFANYTQKFGKHNLNLMLGTSFIESRSFYVDGTSSGGGHAGDDNFDLGFKKDNPLYYFFAYATENSTKSITGGEELKTRQISYFGRASYDYKDTYLAQFSLRADAADLSALPIANRWGYFPAVSLGWVVSNESFMANSQNIISHLKLRANWGQNGSIANLAGYQYAVSIVSGSSYPFTNDLIYKNSARPNYTGNPELRWETAQQTDIGIDARFLKNRLTFAFDYFNKKTKDLIITGAKASTIVGNSPSPINAGNIENSGIELELGWSSKTKKDFTYSIKGNLSTLKNKVTNIHKSIARIDGASFHTTNGITAFEVGYPAWYFRGYKVSGINAETGDPIFEDIVEDGVINDDDRTFIGSGIPSLNYGLTLNAAWKGFDLTVFGTGAYGSEIFMCFNRGDRLQSNMLREFYDDRWTTDNMEASRPRPAATDIDKYWISDAMVYNGSYFKIKQIQLGYSIPKNLLAKVKLTNVRAYCSLDDFFTFSAYPGFDPETVGFGNSLGVDKGYYPSSKKVVFGVNVTF